MGLEGHPSFLWISGGPLEGPDPYHLKGLACPWVAGCFISHSGSASRVEEVKQVVNCYLSFTYISICQVPSL